MLGYANKRFSVAICYSSTLANFLPENWQCIAIQTIDISTHSTSEPSHANSRILDPSDFTSNQQQVLWHGCGTEVRTLTLILPAGATYDDIFDMAIMKIEEMPDHESWRWELRRSDNDIDYELFITPRANISKVQRLLNRTSGHTLESWYPPCFLKPFHSQADMLITGYEQTHPGQLADTLRPAAVAATAAVIAGTIAHQDGLF